MNLTGIRFFLLLVALSFGMYVHAYEQPTHRKMSEAAANASILVKDATVMQNLGIKSSDSFLNSKNSKKSIVELIQDGADFEDNTPRPVNHFYDPLNDRPLIVGIHVGYRSPDWALEDKTDFGDQQEFSFRDARGFMSEALTAKSEQERNARFGLLFQALGQVIHHLQDMAQPQHVRNDQHLDFEGVDWRWLENPSLYEQYTKDHPEKLTPLFGLYPPINSKDDSSPLATARSFWHTQNKNPVVGLGVAEFTSTNFLSAGTNFDATAYPSPNLGNATPWDDNANNLLEKEGLIVPPDCMPPRQPCVMTFYRSHVQDSYRSAASKYNDYTSTLSIFDQDLQVQNKRAFSLNRFNFNAAHEFLIPRAVAYSTGLIDYFFRGKLGAEDVTFTDTGISLRVRNAIDPQETPAWANETLYAKNSNGSAGSLVVAFDYQDSAGKTQYGASNPVPLRATDTLVPGQVSDGVYDFTLTVPPEAKEVNYRLVFRGRLGQEDDTVAVGKVEPISGFVVYPNYLPADGTSGPRAILKQGGQWKLSEKKDLVAGNVDWKGWYRNGRPTKVLSWSGPTIRYFPDNQNWLRSVIYRDGKIFDYAPADVLAAAVARDTSGVEWVVAICKEGLLDVVYRRLSTKSDPPDPREQWQEIARLDATADDANDGATTSAADIPWFFNGAGTEAQTMRSWRVNSEPYRGQRRKRLIISLSSTLTDAKLNNLGNLDGFRETQTCSGGYDTRGAGSVQINFRGEGSYIVAVDYKDDQEVRAKVRLDATTTSTSTVTAIEVSKDNYVQVGKTSIDQSWIEYFEWGGQEQIHYFDKKKYTASWSTASSPRQDQVGTIDIRWKYYLYGLDLRDNVYAYTFWNVNHRNEWNTDGLDGRTGTWAEGGEILSKKNSLVNFFGPISFESTTDMQPLGAIGCGQEWSSTKYGSLDFSSPVALGSIAVDTGGNIAASFYYRDIADNQIHGPVNHLSGGSLEGTIPGAPASPEYQPIGVIY